MGWLSGWFSRNRVFFSFMQYMKLVCPRWIFVDFNLREIFTFIASGNHQATESFFEILLKICEMTSNKKISEVFGKRGTSFTQFLFILLERSFRNSRLSSNWRAVIKRIRRGAKNGSMRYFPWITPNCRCLCRLSSNELQSLPLLYLLGTKWAVIGLAVRILKCGPLDFVVCFPARFNFQEILQTSY